MAVVHAWLSVCDETPRFGKNPSLFERLFHFDVPPRTGDAVHIFYNVGGDEWWFDHEIKRHYWNGDGTYHVEFRPILVDPTPEGEEQNRPHTWQGKEIPGYHTQWWTERDGDVRNHLIANGWEQR